MNIRSFASRFPSTRGSRCVAPTVPQSASGVRNDASGVATMKSQAAAISQPEPTAAACTTAITGIGRRSSASYAANAFSRRARTWSSFMPWRSLRSAPAQNTGPLPRTNTTRTLSSAAALAAAPSNPSHIALLSALRLSGRFSVIVATPSATA